jgi:hypothetical protein
MYRKSQNFFYVYILTCFAPNVRRREPYETVEHTRTMWGEMQKFLLLKQAGGTCSNHCSLKG